MTKADRTKLYEEKLRSIDDALAFIKSGDIVFTTNNYSEPGAILSRLHEIAPRVENVKVWKGRSGIYPFMNDPAMKGHVEMYTYFFGPLFYRESQPMGLVDYVPADLQSYFTTAVAGHKPTVCMTAEAQRITDAITAAGIRGIWNFTNTEITTGEREIPVEDVHFSDSFLTLSYFLAQDDRANGRL